MLINYIVAFIFVSLWIILIRNYTKMTLLKNSSYEANILLYYCLKYKRIIRIMSIAGFCELIGYLHDYDKISNSEYRKLMEWVINNKPTREEYKTLKITYGEIYIPFYFEMEDFQIRRKWLKLKIKQYEKTTLINNSKV